MEEVLNIAAWEERSIVNGPGERFVLWVQGCPFRCPGCFNPGYLDFNERRGVRVDELAEKIKRVHGIEGVTYSGGEPMAHSRGLYHLSKQLRKAGLTIVCYSGYTLEELKMSDDPWVAQLISSVDILIDGRYEKQQDLFLPWRGSANQQVHFLTDAYSDLAEKVEEERREVELIIGEKGFVSTGIFDAKFLKRLDQLLKGDVEQSIVSDLPADYKHR